MMFTGASHAMADNVKATDRGVEIYVADASSASAGVVRLSVITDNIVRVEAVPGDSLPAPRASLMVVPQEPCGRFDCTERGDSVHLTTRTLLVSVSKATGASCSETGHRAVCCCAKRQMAARASPNT